MSAHCGEAMFTLTSYCRSKICANSFMLMSLYMSFPVRHASACVLALESESLLVVRFRVAACPGDSVRCWLPLDNSTLPFIRVVVDRLSLSYADTLNRVPFTVTS